MQEGKTNIQLFFLCILEGIIAAFLHQAGDFFMDSSIILLAVIIWFLRICDNRRYCTFPHAIELLNKKYANVFAILTSFPELENYL